eukprot:Lithocolla_globosa_v1_NODE_963_length_3017_cov_27.468940.p3 type:complete len:124 gc:universal NODE_963_length_3017_cov_27.468940:1338-967(-)
MLGKYKLDPLYNISLPQFSWKARLQKYKNPQKGFPKTIALALNCGCSSAELSMLEKRLVEMVIAGEDELKIGLSTWHKFSLMSCFLANKVMKMTGIELDLFTNIDLYQFFQKGIRGGSTIMDR